MSIIKYTGVDILRNEFVVLKDVNFEINEGNFVYLIGNVGSGKSSLMKSLYAEIPLEGNGTARILDYDLYHFKRRQIPYLRRRLGIVFQDFQLLPDRSVGANLEFVLRATGWKKKEEIRERIISVLDEVGMFQKAHKMPHELSGGEQQRVAIARALLNNPDIILADEPTGNLDPSTSNEIIHKLHDLVKDGKRSVIIATHNHRFPVAFPGIIYRCDEANKKITRVQISKKSKPSSKAAQN